MTGDDCSKPSRIRAFLARLRDDPGTATGLLVGVTLGGAMLTLQTRLSHDVGWLLVGARRLLAGAELYRTGFVDVNPPLAVYVLTPAAAAAATGVISEVTALRLQLLLACAGLLLLCNALLRGLFQGADPARCYWLAGVAFVAGVLPAILPLYEVAAFAQREHWILLFLLPYVFSTAARLRDRPLSTGTSFFVGLLVGLAVSMKPYYATVPLALEVLVLAHARTPRVLIRPEILAIGGVGTTYLASVVLLTPGYLELALPLALDSYWAYQRPLSELIHPLQVSGFAAAAGLVWITPGEGPSRVLGAGFLAAAAAAYVSYLLGGTIWSYHLLACQGLLILAALAPLCATTAARSEAAANRRLRAASGGVIGALCGILAVSPWGLGESLRLLRSPSRPVLNERIQTIIERYGRGGPVLSLSTSVPPAFPALNYAGVDWSLRHSCLWPLRAVFLARGGQAGDRKRLSPERVAELEAYVRRTLLEDVSERRPRLAIVDRRPTVPGLNAGRIDLLGFLLEDPEFETFWRGYDPLLRVGFFEIYQARERVE